ncbi:MAG: hypothetical protein ACRES5_12065 [Pseudomonas sp.]
MFFIFRFQSGDAGYWNMPDGDIPSGQIDATPVGAGLPAMVVNDNAYELDKRGELESIAGKPAPTGSRECEKNLIFR